MTDDSPAIGIGMVGHAFMGRVHSQAWRTAARFFELPLRPDMAALCGTSQAAVAASAERLGWRSWTTDWRELLERDDVDLIDICSPGDTHAEIAIAALDSGRHVLCEKPLANSVEEARAMVAAAERARPHGVRDMVGFTYRRVPAVVLARELVAQGRIGQVRHVRCQYLQDWLVDPDFPLTWRLQADKAGSGALGDLGAHIVDLAQFVTADRITGVTGITETFITERPLPASSDERGPVTVDDAAVFVGRLGGGALATFEATRFAAGRKNGIRIEVNGSAGSLAFDFESMNELWFYDGTEDPRDRRLPPDSGHRDPSTPTSTAGGRPGTRSASSTASPTRSSTSSATSRPVVRPGPRSPTACRSSWCWRRSDGSAADGGWQPIQDVADQQSDPEGTTPR